MAAAPAWPAGFSSALIAKVDTTVWLLALIFCTVSIVCTIRGHRSARSDKLSTGPSWILNPKYSMRVPGIVSLLG